MNDNCEKIKNFQAEFATLKKEKAESLDLQPFIIKLINFVIKTNCERIEPYSKIKSFYDKKQINYEYELVIPLIDILLKELEERFCKEYESIRRRLGSKGRIIE